MPLPLPKDCSDDNDDNEDDDDDALHNSWTPGMNQDWCAAVH